MRRKFSAKLVGVESLANGRASKESVYHMLSICCYCCSYTGHSNNMHLIVLVVVY